MPSKCFYFFLNGLEQVSKSFFLARNGSEWNSGFFSLLRNGLERNSEHFLYSSEWFRTNLQSSECFLFYEMVRNFELFYLPWYGWERNSERLHSAKQTEFRRNKSNFPSVPCTAKYFFLRKWQPYSSIVAASAIFQTRIWGCYELISKRVHFVHTIMGTSYGALGPDFQRQFVTWINV